MTGGEHTLDRALGALGHPLRRAVLVRIRGPDGAVTVEDIAVDEQAMAALYHHHLPRLARAGYVERRSDAIRPGPRFEEVAPLVALLDEHRERLPGEWP
ncbi:MAG: hypothetical protein ABEJ89_03755 [Haloarculaceae archaeon]